MNPKQVDGLSVEIVGDEILVFNDAESTAAALNGAAAAVFDLCDGSRDVDAIVDILSSAEPPLGNEQVALALLELEEAGLIVDTPPLNRPSRRALLAKLGGGAAALLALPVVESMVAPTPAHAQSPPPTGTGPTAATTTTAQPTTAQPTAQPTGEPTTAQPTAEPTTSQPTTSQPTTSQPTTSQPTTSRPTTSQPTTSRPTPAPFPVPVIPT